MKKLDQILENFFSEYLDMDLSFEEGERFEYDEYEDKIYYSFTEEDNDLFYLNVPENLRSLDPFVINLFHEVGHSISDNDFDQKTFDEYEKMISSFDDELTDEDYKKYYNHPIEKKATEEGCSLILDLKENNLEAFKDLLQKILTVLHTRK